jgi:hypothetical protein
MQVMENTPRSRMRATNGAFCMPQSAKSSGIAIENRADEAAVRS